MEKIIGFVGPFCDTNYGDYAMLVNNYYSMAVSQSVVFVNDDSEASLNEILSYYNMKSDVCRVSINEGISEYLGNYPFTPLEIVNSCLNVFEVEKKLESIDLLVVSGGGMFNDLWNFPHRRKRLFSVLSTIFIGVSIE